MLQLVCVAYRGDDVLLVCLLQRYQKSLFFFCLHSLGVHAPCPPPARPRYPTLDSRASGGQAIVHNMEQTLAVLREELEAEVQALSKSRSVEDRATLMAKEADINKVCETENR